MFLTDILFNSPRLWFSDGQKRAILKWANALHAKNVPSLHALQKCQNMVRSLVGDPTAKVVSSSGNIFYLNNVASAIAKVCDVICLEIRLS